MNGRLGVLRFAPQPPRSRPGGAIPQRETGRVAVVPRLYRRRTGAPYSLNQEPTGRRRPCPFFARMSALLLRSISNLVLAAQARVCIRANSPYPRALLSRVALGHG